MFLSNKSCIHLGVIDDILRKCNDYLVSSNLGECLKKSNALKETGIYKHQNRPCINFSFLISNFEIDNVQKLCEQSLRSIKYQNLP